MGLTNSQYDTILREYEQKQSYSRNLQSKRHEEVLKSIPEYRDLEMESSSIAMKYARIKIDNPEADTGSMKNEMNEVSRKKEALLLTHGFPKNFLDPVYECADCHDSGYIGNEKCHCFKQKMITLLYEQSGIQEMLNTENFSTLSFDYFDGEDQKKLRTAVENCRNFINNFNTDYRNLFFYGTVGTGKSFLSGCIAKEILESGHSVIYFSAAELFERLSKNTFQYKNNKEIPDVLIQDLYSCDLLIIDDLGTEFSTALSLSEFFSCINERHLRKKSTIISTNLTLDDLHERYKDRIFSRISSHYDLIKLTGPDIRMLKKRMLNRK